jgi:hypothetical protein
LSFQRISQRRVPSMARYLPPPVCLWHSPIMCFRITATGRLLPLSSRTEHDEVMLHCARIGYNP